MQAEQALQVTHGDQASNRSSAWELSSSVEWQEVKNDYDTNDFNCSKPQRLLGKVKSRY